MIIEKFEIQQEERTIKGKVYKSEESMHNSVIILSHEFGLNMLSTKRYAKRLCRMGYITYIFDFVGSGAGSSKGFDSTEMSVSSQKEDLSEVLDYVKQEHNGKIVLAGASQGGMVTALLAAEREADIDKIVLIYPALCIPDDARRGCIIGTQIDSEHIPDKFTAMGYVKLGKKYVQDAKALEPWREIKGFHKPVLILHGDKDGIVPLSYAQKACECYENARLYIYQKARHLFLRIKEVNKAVADIDAFISGYEEALCIDVKINGFRIKGNKLYIDFSGNSIGTYFKGSIKPNAVDTWVFHQGRCVSKRADYIIATEMGEVHVINEDTGNGWIPTVEVPNCAQFDLKECYAIVKQRWCGPLVRIYAKRYGKQ